MQALIYAPACIKKSSRLTFCKVSFKNVVTFNMVSLCLLLVLRDLQRLRFPILPLDFLFA